MRSRTLLGLLGSLLLVAAFGGWAVARGGASVTPGADSTPVYHLQGVPADNAKTPEETKSHMDAEMAIIQQLETDGVNHQDPRFMAATLAWHAAADRYCELAPDAANC